MRCSWSAALVLALAALLASAAGCKDDEKKGGSDPDAPPPADVEGLEAIPATARVVLGFDVARLAESPLVQRAVHQMFARDEKLKERVDRLVEACQLDPADDLESVVLGMGARREDVVLVASGRLEEGKLVSCVGDAVLGDGGKLTTIQVAGRDAYHVDSGPGRAPVYFAFGSDSTVVVSSTEEWLEKGLSPGESVTDDPRLAGLIERAGTDKGIWGAGLIPEAVGEGLLQSAGGAIEEPPGALFAHLDLKEGIEAELGAEMASAKDAKSLVSFAKPQVSAMSLVAQRYGVGPLVNKIRLDAEDEVVYLRLSLTAQEVRDLARRIDTRGGDLQDSGPPPDPEGATDDAEGDAPPDGQTPVRE